METPIMLGRRGDDQPLVEPVIGPGMTPAERLTHLETAQRYQNATLANHAIVHAELSKGLTAVSMGLAKLERKLILAAAILFAGTSNGSEIAKLVAASLS